MRILRYVRGRAQTNLMAKLLFLTHRVPYPPNKGERIRAFYPLRHLAKRHEVWLGALADSQAEIAQSGELQALCTEVHLALHPRSRQQLGMMLGAATGRALSLSAFDNHDLRAWCAHAIASVKPDLIYVVSSAMAQYVMGTARGANILMDFVDAELREVQPICVHAARRDARDL